MAGRGRPATSNSPEAIARRERRQRAKVKVITGTVTLWLQADRADVVATLVQGGYIPQGSEWDEVPTEKEIQEAAQKHYSDIIKSRQRAPRILQAQPESKVFPPGYYDKHMAATLMRIGTPEEVAAFIKSRPEVAVHFEQAKREDIQLTPPYRLHHSPPPWSAVNPKGPRRTKSTGYLPPVKGGPRPKSWADTVPPMKKMGAKKLDKAVKELGVKVQPDADKKLLVPDEGIERVVDKQVALGEVGVKRKYTGKIHHRDDGESGS